MPRDKALNHDKIIRAAMDEFSEYGYADASMRRIGQRCGLTAAALYRHFDSKEAMFASLVEPAVRDLREWIDTHYGNLSDKERRLVPLTGAEDDIMRDLIYPRKEEYSLLINKSGGSRYSGFLDELVRDHQELMLASLSRRRDMGYNVREVSAEELHILITAYCTALLEPIAHGYSLEDALRYLGTVEEFFAPGWNSLLGIA